MDAALLSLLTTLTVVSLGHPSYEAREKATNECALVWGWFAYQSDDLEVKVRVEARYLQITEADLRLRGMCSNCGRRTWSENDVGKFCNAPQIHGGFCQGQILRLWTKTRY